MFKKLFLIVLVMTATLGFAQEAEFKTINNLIYHKSMFNASESVDLLKIPFGSEASQVGGQDQDTDAMSYGVPWAFRMAEGGNVWVLDSLNRQLKLFKPDATVEKHISLEGFGKIVIDFAVAADGRMAFLNSADGFIYITDAKGEKIHSIEGFNGARAIEFDRNGELLVSHPVIQSVLRFGQNGELAEQMVGDQSLSLYSDPSGKLFGLEISDLEASLYLRTVASPAETLVIGKFPYAEKHPGVTYAGGEILGLDAAGNVYFCLVACHEEGQIYRERLYRCAPDGKVLGELDIHTIPHLAPDLPRKRVVCPDGRVMGFYPTEEHFVLCVYAIP
jgi:hypothetical protein